MSALILVLVLVVVLVVVFVVVVVVTGLNVDFNLDFNEAEMRILSLSVKLNCNSMQFNAGSRQINPTQYRYW